MRVKFCQSKPMALNYSKRILERNGENAYSDLFVLFSHRK